MASSSRVLTTGLTSDSQFLYGLFQAREAIKESLKGELTVLRSLSGEDVWTEITDAVLEAVFAIENARKEGGDIENAFRVAGVNLYSKIQGFAEEKGLRLNPKKYVKSGISIEAGEGLLRKFNAPIRDALKTTVKGSAFQLVAEQYKKVFDAEVFSRKSTAMSEAAAVPAAVSVSSATFVAPSLAPASVKSLVGFDSRFAAVPAYLASEKKALEEEDVALREMEDSSEEEIRKISAACVYARNAFIAKLNGRYSDNIEALAANCLEFAANGVSVKDIASSIEGAPRDAIEELVRAFTSGYLRAQGIEPLYALAGQREESGIVAVNQRNRLALRAALESLKGVGASSAVVVGAGSSVAASGGGDFSESGFDKRARDKMIELRQSERAAYQMKREEVERARGAMIERRMGSVVKKWRQEAAWAKLREGVEVVKAEKKAETHDRRRVLKKTFDALGKYRDQQQESRRRLREAVIKHRRSVARKYFDQWREANQEAKKRREALEKLESVIDKRQLRRGFKALQEQLDARKSELAKPFEAWSVWTKAKQTERMKGAHAQRHHDTKVLQGAFESWKSKAKTQQDFKEILRLTEMLISAKFLEQGVDLVNRLTSWIANGGDKNYEGLRRVFEERVEELPNFSNLEEQGYSAKAVCKVLVAQMANRMIEDCELTREEYLTLRKARVAMTIHLKDENEDDVRLIEKCRKVVLKSEKKEEVKYWYNQVGGDRNEDLEKIEEMLRQIGEGGQEVDIYDRKISKEQALFLAETLLMDLAVSQPYEKMEKILGLCNKACSFMKADPVSKVHFLREIGELESVIENVRVRLGFGKYIEEIEDSGEETISGGIEFIPGVVVDFIIQARYVSKHHCRAELSWLRRHIDQDGNFVENLPEDKSEDSELLDALKEMGRSLERLASYLDYEMACIKPRSHTAIMEAELACLSSGSDEEEEDVTVTASNSTSVIRQRIREVAAELIEHLGERGMSGVAIKDVRKLEDLKKMDETRDKEIAKKIDELQSKGLSEDFLQGAIVEEMTAKCMRDLCNHGLRWDPNRARFNSVQKEIEILQDARNQNERQVLFKLSVAEEGIKKELLGEYLQESRDRHVRYAEELSARFCEFYPRTEFSPEIVPEMLEVLLGVVSEGNTKVRFNEMNGEVDIEDALYMVFGLFEQNLGSYKPEEVKGLYQSFVVASRQVMESRKSEVSYEESEEVPDFVMPVAREVLMKAEKVRLESEMREYFGGIVNGDMSLVGSNAESMSPCMINEYLLDLVYLPVWHDDADAVLIFDQKFGNGVGSRIKDEYKEFFDVLDEKRQEWCRVAKEVGISAVDFYIMMLGEYQEIVVDKELQEDYFVSDDRFQALQALEEEVFREGSESSVGEDGDMPSLDEDNSFDGEGVGIEYLRDRMSPIISPVKGDHTVEAEDAAAASDAEGFSEVGSEVSGDGSGIDSPSGSVFKPEGSSVSDKGLVME